ncbi:MAG: histidine--tRNA ligase [Phycisphaeraceae bacterium]|nr:histidine--tRNA ligase [Phycisphaeraceae bacterium]
MKLQAPKGTRDFYPREMAWQNFLFDAWRKVSVRNGFEQVDGPVFESLDLYKVKSGDGIVSELFHFEDRGGRGMAIRPEFTPTLARMVADRAASLPRPIKWFCMPNFCRAERPQRGRLREFWQWNIDMLGLDSPIADAEVIYTAVDFLREVGLTSSHVRIKLSHRQTVQSILGKLGVPLDRMTEAFALLDRRDKIEEDQFAQQAAVLGLDADSAKRFDEVCRMKYRAGGLDKLRESLAIHDTLDDLRQLDEQLHAFGIADWCEYDLGIVRGLAYYTGTVFEIHETTGAMRAIAGGGRYDRLIELFGGPPTPAVGFGMGDVVISLVLFDKGLIPETIMPRPDVFALALTDAAAKQLAALCIDLRRQGLHTRFSYRSTRSLGKLLKEATACNARYAVILDDKIMERQVEVKDLESGEQWAVGIDQLPQAFSGRARDED